MNFGIRALIISLLLAVALISVIGIPNSYAVCNGVCNQINGSQSGMTTKCTLPVTSGDLIVVEFAYNVGATFGNVTGISDNFSNTYTKQVVNQHISASLTVMAGANIYTASSSGSGSALITITENATVSPVEQCYDVRGFSTAGITVFSHFAQTNATVAICNHICDSAALSNVNQALVFPELGVDVSFTSCVGGNGNCFIAGNGMTQDQSITSNGVNGHFTGVAGTNNFNFNFTNGAPNVNQPAVECFSYIVLSPQTFTVTSTITGWQIPNFANCPSAQCGVTVNWFFGMIVWLLPVGMIDSFFVIVSPHISQQTLVFLNLGGLLTGAIIGSMLFFLPTAIPFICGIVFVVYLWKGRG